MIWRVKEEGRGTGSAGKHLLIVNVSLDPSHEVLYVCRGGHFGWSFVVFGVLPEIFESVRVSKLATQKRYMAKNSLICSFHLRT
jgi:hypothetical protein